MDAGRSLSDSSTATLERDEEYSYKRTVELLEETDANVNRKRQGTIKQIHNSNSSFQIWHKNNGYNLHGIKK